MWARSGRSDLPLARFSGVDDANSSVVSYPACDKAKRVDLGSARVEIGLDAITLFRSQPAGSVMDREQRLVVV